MASLRKLFLDGLLIAIPIACLAILAVHVVKFFRDVVRPLLPFLHIDSWLGLGLLTICALLATMLVVLVFGLIVRWKARRILERFERKVLNRIPIYQVIRRVSEDVVDPDGVHYSVLVDVHGTGSSQFGLLVEEVGEDRTVVFLPDAPSATTGRVYLVPNERLSRLDATGFQVMEVVGDRGLGATQILAGAPVAGS